MASTKNQGFKGGFAFSTDFFIDSINIPVELQSKIGVMINASELVSAESGFEKVLEKLFLPKVKSPVSLVVSHLMYMSLSAHFLQLLG